MILVLGGAGYIGSHMLKVLREACEPHIVFDNLERGHRDAVLGSKLVVGDLRDPVALKKVFESYPIDVVMHFAAYIEVGESTKLPAEFYRNNVYGAMVLLDQMRESKVDKFVFSSTAAVYGEPEYLPLDEKHPKAPTNPYGDTKLAVERMLDAYGEAYGIRAVCLRYFNAAGADPDGVLGEDHDPETHLVPLVIQAALGRRPAIKVFGTDYDTPDGTGIRDYVHVIDLAKAHLMAVNHLRKGGMCRTFNLGTGTGKSVKEVIASVERVTGKNVPVEYADRRAGDTARLIASSDAIQSEWGWKPEFSDLDDLVRHAYNWMEAHPDGYKIA